MRCTVRVVVVHAAMSEHSPFQPVLPDPAPEDNLAFRIVDHDRAPEGHLRALIEQCGCPLSRLLVAGITPMHVEGTR